MAVFATTSGIFFGGTPINHRSVASALVGTQRGKATATLPLIHAVTVRRGHGEALLDGHLMGAVAIHIVERSGAAIGKVGQRDIRCLQRESRRADRFMSPLTRLLEMLSSDPLCLQSNLLVSP